MYKLFSDIIITEGAKRDLLVDIRRNKIQLIPKEITKFLGKLELEEIVYSKDDKNLIKELLEEEIIFEISKDEKDFFPKISLDWDQPSVITNSVIEVTKSTIQYLPSILSQLEDLQCRYISFIIQDEFSSDDYDTIEKALNSQALISFELALNYYNTEACHYFLERVPGLFRMSGKAFLFNCINPAIEQQFKNDFIFKTGLYSSTCCGSISKEQFTVNIELFSESQHHNTCLNRKLSVDGQGCIKNCPGMKQSFGDIKNSSLETALSKEGFKKLWNIKKDEIAVCKDCEFRHICTDCRAFTENPNDIYSKPLKCGYSPYTNKWEEWSTNPLKQEAISFYGMRENLERNNV